MCVCFVCLQGRGSKGHSCLKSPLEQRITWGLPGLHIHTYTPTELMEEAWYTVEPWGQNSLALNYISQHDRSRSRVELLFHFEFGLGVKVPYGCALHYTSLLCFLSISHTHKHTQTHTHIHTLPKNTRLNKSFHQVLNKKKYTSKSHLQL